MMLGVVLGMLLRVVQLGKMSMRKKNQMRKKTMEVIKMQKMELTMEMVCTNSGLSFQQKNIFGLLCTFGTVGTEAPHTSRKV